MIRLLLVFAVTVWLTGCERPPIADTRRATPQNLPAAEPRPLASWSAYNYRPAFYAGEELLVYEDGRCVLRGPAAENHPRCEWRSDGEHRVEFMLGAPAGPLVPVAGILADSALEDLRGDGSSCYLYLDFGDGRRRLFVLEGTRDAEMVRTAVEAELAWQSQELWKAIGKFQHAVDMGSPFARMRLGWILATTPELLDAREAIALLQPIKDRDHYHVANALAAAHAAAGDFGAAVDQASRACRLLGPQSVELDECRSRLSLYSHQRQYLVSLDAIAAP